MDEARHLRHQPVKSPEPVLTAPQWKSISRVAEMGNSGTGAANDYSVRIDNVTVTDVEHLRREIDSRQRLQMMRYAGRP
jgi:hypothetical protein